MKGSLSTIESTLKDLTDSTKELNESLVFETDGCTKDKPTLNAAELLKANLENQQLRKDLGKGWRILKGAALVFPGITVIASLVLLSVGILEYRNSVTAANDEKLRSLLKEIGSKEITVRLSAVSRLSTLDAEANKPDTIVATIKAALWIEDSLVIKKGILKLLTEHYKSRALPPLKNLRIELIRQLKLQHAEKLPTYWSNLRETLFYVALAIADVSGNAPDFRCFPLQHFKIRQTILPENSNFEGATLFNAEFWGGSAIKAKFNHANLKKIRMANLNIAGADFTGALLVDATIGPGIIGASAKNFKDSDWRKAKSLPTNLKSDLEKTLGKNSGHTHKGKNRNEICSKILTEDFSTN